MTAIKVVVTDHGFPDLQTERSTLSQINAQLAEFQCTSTEEVVHAVKDADAILTQWAPIDRKVMASLTRCKVIVRYGIGVDNVDLEAAGEQGIPVVNVPDYALNEVADHAMALLLASVRKIPQVLNQVKGGVWETNPCRPMFSLADRTIGLAGFGNIAKKVAVRAQAFGLRVAAYDPYVPEEDFAASQVEPLEWDQLLERSDIISLHLPLTPATHHLVNHKAFAQMKRGSYFINTSRGGLVQTEALISALQSGHLAGAGIDVLEEEPVEGNSSLLTIPSLLLTSHCAWYTEDALQRLKQFAADEIVRVFTGELPKHIVNRKWLKAAQQ